jgi:branched-chain amino acid transport system substrate-binding protein
MRRPGKWTALAAVLALASAAAVFSAAGAQGRPDKGPIVIGAAMDLTAQMSPYDTPALYAVQAEAKKINAAGGVDGRRIVVKVCNHQLKAQQACALKLIKQGAVVGVVTCDVEYAAPAVQEFINRGILTLAPCIGTDQMGPKRFGPKGRLAFTFGNIAQDEAAAMAEYSISRGWKRAVIVKDNLLAYFQNVADLFKQRYEQLGGQVVQEESFTSFSNNIQNAISKVAPTKADVIAFPTAFDGLAPFVGGLRALGNNTPIINSWAGDGNYWWPTNPQVKNYYFVTYGSIYGDDPVSAVNKLVKTVTAANGGKLPATGSFIPGGDLVDGLVSAIKQAHGSTKGAVLANQLEHFRFFPATSGLITFSKIRHGVTGRLYRVMYVNNNKARFLRTWKTRKLAHL